MAVTFLHHSLQMNAFFLSRFLCRTVTYGLCANLLIPCGLSLAARPLITDDARMVDPGACQVETWRRTLKGSREFWAFPACNPGGRLELTLGGNDIPDGNGGRGSDFVFQGKSIVRPLETNGWAWGLAAGVVGHNDRAPGQGTMANRYFYVPVSVSFFDDHIVTHINVGGQDNRDTGRRVATWGLGGEFNFTPRFALIAETYGDDQTRQFYQTGVRFWVIPQHWQIDATVGSQAGSWSSSRWFSLGVRIITAPFLR